MTESATLRDFVPQAEDDPAADQPAGEEPTGNDQPAPPDTPRPEPAATTPQAPPPAPPRESQPTSEDAAPAAPKVGNGKAGLVFGTIAYLVVLLIALVALISFGHVWIGIGIGLILALIGARIFVPRYLPDTSDRRVPTIGKPAKTHSTLRKIGIDYRPPISQEEQTVLSQQAQAVAEQGEFDRLGVEINGLMHELVMVNKDKLVVMAQNQAGTASKTWTTTWLATELAKTTHAGVAYVETRDGSAFGTDILGIPRDQTIDTKELLERKDELGPAGNLDRVAHRSPDGVYGITTRSTRNGRLLTRDEGTESIQIVTDRVSVTFLDPGNTPVSEFNLAACALTDVHVLVCAPNLVAGDNLGLTVRELREQGVDISPDNAFAMLNGWRPEAPLSQWSDRLHLPDGIELYGTAYDPGADITSLSQGINADFGQLRVNLKRVTLGTRISLRRALVKILRLRLAQLQGADS